MHCLPLALFVFSLLFLWYHFFNCSWSRIQTARFGVVISLCHPLFCRTGQFSLFFLFSLTLECEYHYIVVIGFCICSITHFSLQSLWRCFNFFFAILWLWPPYSIDFFAFSSMLSTHSFSLFIRPFISILDADLTVHQRWMFFFYIISYKSWQKWFVCVCIYMCGHANGH